MQNTALQAWPRGGSARREVLGPLVLPGGGSAAGRPSAAPGSIFGGCGCCGGSVRGWTLLESSMPTTKRDPTHGVLLHRHCESSVPPCTGRWPGGRRRRRCHPQARLLQLPAPGSGCSLEHLLPGSAHTGPLAAFSKQLRKPRARGDGLRGSRSIFHFIKGLTRAPDGQAPAMPGDLTPAHFPLSYKTPAKTKLDNRKNKTKVSQRTHQPPAARQ